MSRRIRRPLKILAALFAALLVGLVGFLAVCYIIFFSPRPPDLPCRGCTGDAQAVNINGFDLYYRSVGQRGQNPPVVLVHGGPGMSSQSFKDGFDFLANRYQVVYYDQRGSGNSQIKPDVSNYTMDQLVEELETLRRDVIDTNQMILVGHSAGGALAQRYAFKYPQHVQKMILVASLPANGGFGLSGVVMNAFYAMLNVVGGNIPPGDPEQANAWYAEVTHKSNVPRLYDPGHPELIRDLGYHSYAVSRELICSNFGGNFDEQLKQLPMKTLVIYGDADRSSFTGEPAARQFASLIPQARVVGFAQSGHWPYLEEPERFQQVITEFLNE